MLSSTPSFLDSLVLDTTTISLNGPEQSSSLGMSFYFFFEVISFKPISECSIIRGVERWVLLLLFFLRAFGVALEYGYNVEFTGVGPAPLGQQDAIGFCTQIGVFRRLTQRPSCETLCGVDAEDMFSYELVRTNALYCLGIVLSNFGKFLNSQRNHKGIRFQGL